ncbi:hypothetical protein MKW98_000227, partial [Papaver atlanticum]
MKVENTEELPSHHFYTEVQFHPKFEAADLKFVGRDESGKQLETWTAFCFKSRSYIASERGSCKRTLTSSNMETRTEVDFLRSSSDTFH